jgi:4-amino-4-deoxy-L-arabinose transferase-like glycosyltransferase
LTLAVVGTMLLAGLGTIGLLGPDEPRYAAIAREMAQTGDWVTPRLYGHPWFEKPVLYYWTAASAFRLFGATEFAARLPDALAALFATLAMAWAALRAFGIETAWLTLLMLPTAIAMPVFARAATPDMLFSATLAGAAVAAAELLSKPRAGRVARVAFGSLLGIATLAKGPAAVILAGGAALLWALGSRQWSAALRLANFISVASFCVFAVPWYALVAARNSDFLRIFFLEHNFERYLTPVFHHTQPVWFLTAVILALVFPWTGLLVPLANDALRNFKAGTLKDSPALFFACWAIFPVLFFSFSQSKLPAYILPAVPPLVLLLAASTARRLRGEGQAARWWIVLVGCSLAGLSLGAGYWLRRQAEIPGIAEWEAVRDMMALAIFGGLLCACLGIARRAQAGITAAAVLTATLVIAADSVILPRLDPFLSARTVVQASPEEPRGAPNLFEFDVSPAWVYGLDFYLHRELLPWPPTAAPPLWAWTSAQAGGALLRRNSGWSVVTRIPAGPWLLRLD